MAEEHDKTHRLLFGFPRMIEDLIRLCLPGPWIEHLDFSTLEQVSERLLVAGRGLKRREADLIWRLRYRASQGSDWFYVYLNLEHMSRPRKFMALDMEAYRLAAWKQILRHDRSRLPAGRLPPILSVVFYNGDREWRPRMLSELVHKIPDTPPGSELGTFALVDAQRWTVHKVETPLEALFKLEQVQSIQDVTTATRETAATVRADSELEQAFVALLNNVVLRKLTGPEDEPLHIEHLEEIPMLEQRIERIVEGLILQGEEKGLREGQESLFLKLFAVKFKDIPVAIRERAASATGDQLERWSERLLFADSVDAIFED